MGSSSATELGDDQVDQAGHCGRHGWSEAYPVIRVGNVDSENHEFFRHSGQGVTQRAGLRQSERVRAHHRGGFQFAACPAPNPAGRGIRTGRRVNHDGVRRAAPGVQQRSGFTNPAHHPHVGKVTFGDLFGDREADAVVATKVVADPDNYVVRCQRRSTVSVRKCAEHEMQGS